MNKYIEDIKYTYRNTFSIRSISNTKIHCYLQVKMKISHTSYQYIYKKFIQLINSFGIIPKKKINSYSINRGLIDVGHYINQLIVLYIHTRVRGFPYFFFIRLPNYSRMNYIVVLGHKHLYIHFFCRILSLYLFFGA